MLCSTCIMNGQSWFVTDYICHIINHVVYKKQNVTMHIMSPVFTKIQLCLLNTIYQITFSLEFRNKATYVTLHVSKYIRQQISSNKSLKLKWAIILWEVKLCHTSKTHTYNNTKWKLCTQYCTITWCHRNIFCVLF